MNKSKITLSLSFGKALIAKKSVRLLLEIGGSCLALLLLIFFLLLGRLSMGPINLDFLTSEIEAALKTPQGEFKASVAHTQLVWREWQHPFEIELVDVHCQKQQDPHWLRIEHVGVSLQLHQLFGGEVVLKQLRLYRPHILLEKDKEGKFILGLGEAERTQEFSFEELAPLLAMGSFNTALGKLNDLQRISIIDAHVVLKDETAGREWELPKTSLFLKREKNGFESHLILTPLQGKGSLTVGVKHKLRSARFDLSATFSQIAFKSLIGKDRPTLCEPDPNGIAFDDILNLFQHWDIPLDGKAYIALVPSTLEVIEGGCDVNLGKGELDLSVANLRPLSLESGNLSLFFSPQEIKLKNAALLSEEMLLQLSGKLTSQASPLVLTQLLGPEQVLEIHGKVEDLLLDHLAALWPQNLAPSAREWLTQNLRKGTLTNGTLSFKGQGDETGFRVDNLEGTLLGEEAEITYLEGLPPVQNVKVTATFDQKGFDIKILSGNLEGFDVQEGHIVISGLDVDKEFLSLDIKGKGPLSDILDAIDHKPLGYPSAGGIDPKKVKGDGGLTLHMDFPLLADLKFKDVLMTLKGSFKKVELEREITENLTAQLSDASLSVDLTQDQMTVQGKGILNQLPSSLTYTHDFTSSKPYELQIEIDTHASFADFSRLGFNYEDYGQGPLKTKLVYTLHQQGMSQLLVDLDTTFASLSFPSLQWEKKGGEKGALSFVLLLEDGSLSRITDLKMLSPLYSLQGNIHFDSQKNWQTIHLTDLKGPHTETQVTLNRPKENTYQVSFKGQRVDLEKFLEYVNKEDTAKDYPSTDIQLAAEVDQLRLGEGKVFQSVRANADLYIEGKDSFWKEVKLRAKAGQGTIEKGDMAQVSGGIMFDLIPGPNDTQTLTVRANDAGQFLKNLSIYDEIQGGNISIKAERQNHGPYKGVFKLKDFEANKVPLLARFAAILSPIGIVNLFSTQESISMERFDCNFVFDDASVVIQKGIGKSLSLGFTVEGTLHRLKRSYDLKGNLVPARFLNSLLNNIPIVGSLISGGDGEGLFGMAYTVTGSFDQPEISMNPLSMFAPGFLRKLFSPEEEKPEKPIEKESPTE